MLKWILQDIILECFLSLSVDKDESCSGIAYHQYENIEVSIEKGRVKLSGPLMGEFYERPEVLVLATINIQAAVDDWAEKVKIVIEKANQDLPDAKCLELNEDYYDLLRYIKPDWLKVCLLYGIVNRMFSDTKYVNLILPRI